MIGAVYLEIPGNPFGKQRPKFARRGSFVSTYTPNETVNYENLVKLCYRTEYGDFMFAAEEQLEMEIIAIFPVPKSVTKRNKALMFENKIRPTKKPDVDNIFKIIADGLNAIAYADDKQIVKAAIEKRYVSAETESPKVCVKISVIE